MSSINFDFILTTIAIGYCTTQNGKSLISKLTVNILCIILNKLKLCLAKTALFCWQFCWLLQLPRVKNVGKCKKMLENVRYNTGNHIIHDAA